MVRKAIKKKKLRVNVFFIEEIFWLVFAPMTERHSQVPHVERYEANCLSVLLNSVKVLQTRKLSGFYIEKITIKSAYISLDVKQLDR